MNAPLARPGAHHLTDSPNPFLFIVGAARSGTTLVQRVLDAHPLLTVRRFRRAGEVTLRGAQADARTCGRAT